MTEYGLILLFLLLWNLVLAWLTKLCLYITIGMTELTIQIQRPHSSMPFYFKPQKAVQWFDFFTLFKSFQKIRNNTKTLELIDKREIQAGFSNLKIEEPWKNNAEVWFDFLADTGDGFNSTTTVFHALTQPQLKLPFIADKQKDKEEIDLPKPHFVVVGGDLVYPDASEEEYSNRFKGPIRLVSMSPVKPIDINTNVLSPIYLFATPGNHDWYDGLSAFTRMMCQQKNIANFRTSQTRSYFAFEIKNGLHLLGIDNQLLGDIDIPQVEYFKKYIATCKQNKLTVIILVAEPYWYNYSFKERGQYRQRMDSLEYFVKELNAVDKSKTIHVRLVISGDMHHYSRYSERIGQHEDEEGITYITSGGGGAFKHLTHKLEGNSTCNGESNGIELPNLNKHNTAQKYQLASSYYSNKASKKRMWKNVLFPIYNFKFLVLCYLILCLCTIIHSRIDVGLTALVQYAILPAAFYFILKAVELPNEQSKSSRNFKFGLPVFCLSLIMVAWHIACVIVFGPLIENGSLSFQLFKIGFDIKAKLFLLPLLISVIDCMLFGLYLIFQYACFRRNITEVSSSVPEEGYNNFIRCKVTEDTIEVYTIGIDKNINWFKKVKSAMKHNQTLNFSNEPYNVEETNTHVVDHFKLTF